MAKRHSRRTVHVTFRSTSFSRPENREPSKLKVFERQSRRTRCPTRESTCLLRLTGFVIS